ncbi:hypothetical protein [uncultured Pelagimonas sp.]|uniref:hypothetical protein n=1 Tax=uncultured Pelagimonas sp. TaxID=1618102 RepID=UPI00260F384B|nr:hypothetical protein [uncultured Pelagimonas sp.]
MHRIVLTVLALGPALIAALPMSGIAVAVGGLGSAYALVASLRPQPIRVSRVSSGATRATTLLRGPLPKSERSKLPGQTKMSRDLMRILASANDFQPPSVPLDRDTAIARTLMGFMQGWKTQNLASLTETQRAELYLINTMLRASPGEAGRLAQLFARPDTMLDLRDEIDLIALRRAAFDRDYNAFLATQTLWDSNAGPRPLRDTLISLQAEDVDLWHHVVVHHDLRDPDQRKAALWCLQQPACDRATLAAYFGRLTKEQFLRSSGAQADPAYLRAVQKLINDWNAGLYKEHEIALLPPDSVATLQPFFDIELNHLVEETGTIWPNPHCIFVEFIGRPPRPRDHWELRTGQLSEPPRQQDYFESAFEAI